MINSDTKIMTKIKWINKIKKENIYDLKKKKMNQLKN